MSAINSTEQQTYKATERYNITPTADIDAFSFVSHDGALCGAGELAAGVAEYDLTCNELGSIISAQTALVKLAASVTAGNMIASDSSGLGVVANEGDYVNGVACYAGVTGVTVECDLTKSFKI
jgi:hypothetical protein